MTAVRTESVQLPVSVTCAVNPAAMKLLPLRFSAERVQEILYPSGIDHAPLFQRTSAGHRITDRQWYEYHFQGRGTKRIRKAGFC